MTITPHFDRAQREASERKTVQTGADWGGGLWLKKAKRRRE
jgi:hypothetical protein